MAYSELEGTTEEEINYLLKSKEYLEGEVEDNKWNFEKMRDSYEEMVTKNKELN